MNTGRYASYFADHRMESLRERVGWDLKTLGSLGFMPWVRRLDIEYLRAVRGEQQITITSFVREFRGPDALIECSMADATGKQASRCLMTVAHVDKQNNRASNWPPELMALFFEN